jgi:hypothetical protein
MSEAKLDYMQVRKAAGLVVAAASHVNVKESSLSKIVALAGLHARQAPSRYAYQSNDILQTLRELLDTFNQKKKESDEDEFKTKSAFDKEDLNMKNLKQFKLKEKKELEEEIDSMSEEKEAAESDRSEELNDKTSDENFLHVLVGECESKAGEWDARSKTRADELTAIAKAIDALVSSVAPSWKANKKLVGLQQSSKVMGKLTERPASFLQVRGSQQGANTQASAEQQVRVIAKQLSEKAARLNSSILEAASVRTLASGDHFVKVRSIIEDLMARLIADRDAEATQKSTCDKMIKENVDGRDEAKGEVETLMSTKHQLDAESAQLAKEIATLSADIASLRKALNEATELRNEESEENEKTISTASEGASGVKLALSVLNEFYGSESFIQYVPPNSDREGLTVSDRAPETWKSGYEGSKSDAKGIVGLLEVIEADFERTVEETTDSEAQAKLDFEAFTQKTTDDISEKSDSKSGKEGRAVTVDDLLVGNEAQTKMQQGLLTAAQESLDKAKKMCVDGEETYEDRVAKREKEIEALKEAQRILDEWQ